MTIEEINKWLDNEYGISYTKLEELHDFYFEKYCDLKQENQELKRNCNIGYENLNFYREENQELKKQLDKMKQIQCNFLGTGCKRKIEEYEVQQKEFINYLKSMLENEKDNFSVARVKDVLLKYKEIIGVKDE